MEKIIVAQQYTTKMGIQGWAVGITGESKMRMFLRTAKKAMGYMFVLKGQTGIAISENCLQRLSFAFKSEKENEQAMKRLAEQQEYMDRVANKPLDEAAAEQRKEKKQRRSKKNSK